MTALGAVFVVFQWGRDSSLFRDHPRGTVSYVPIILLAVIFGLSNDYEVFVVSRIKDGSVTLRARRNSEAAETPWTLILVPSRTASTGSAPPSRCQVIGFGMAVWGAARRVVVRLTLVPAMMPRLRERFWTAGARERSRRRWSPGARGRRSYDQTHDDA